MKRTTAIEMTVLAAMLSGCAAPSSRVQGRHVSPLPAKLRSSPRAAPEAQVELPTAEPAGEASGPDDGVTPRVVSLVEVLQIANEQAAEVLEAAARLDAEAGRRLEAIGAVVPQIEAGGRVRHLSGREIGSLGVVRDDLSFTELEAGAGLHWRVNPGVAAARIAANTERLEAAEHRVADAQRRAMLAAGVAYHELLLARAALDIAERRKADAESFRDMAQSRASAGVTNEADVQRAKIELAQARKNAIDARQAWEQASIALATLLRGDPTIRLVPEERTVRTTTMVNYAATDELELEASHRPDLEAAKARAEAASEESSAAWWALLGPELDAHGGASALGLTDTDLRPQLVGQVLVGWTIGLGDVGRVRTAGHEARAEAIAAEYKHEQVRAEVRAAAVRVGHRAEAIEQTRSAVDAAQRNRDIQRARFESGTALGFEVIDAQKALARARLALVQSVIRYNIEQIRLLASVGRLSPEGARR